MPQDRGGQDRYDGGQDRYGGGGDRDGGRGNGGRGDGGRNSHGGGGSGREFGSSIQRGGGRGGRDFGSGMQREGGRGGRGFGERGGGRGGRGRGGRAPSGIVENPTMALSNLIPTDITTNFRFYLYGVDCRHKDGQQILSRRRRGELFHAGLNGLMDHYFPGKKGKREREDVERITFFEGSFFFSSRPVVGLDPKTIREIGLVGDEDSGKAYARSDNGDTCRVTGVQCFSKPEELMDDDDDDDDPNAPVKKEELEMNGFKAEVGNVAGEEKKESDSDLLSRPGCLISVDFRCADCTIAFRSKGSMLSHCKALGHSPVYSLDPSEDVDIRPANIHQFLSYCNIVLQRAMSERMARWGREYIDPSSFTEPMDERSGISYGVKVFRAYSCDFGLCRFKNKQRLTLTVDLRAKVLRTKSLLDQMSGGKYDGGRQFADERSRDMVRRKWVNEQVICMYDKRTYSVIDILFGRWYIYVLY